MLHANHIVTGAFTDAMLTDYFLCLPRKRINFRGYLGPIAQSNSGSVLIGIGVNRARFEEGFGQFGKIAFVPERGGPP